MQLNLALWRRALVAAGLVAILLSGNSAYLLLVRQNASHELQKFGPAFCCTARRF